MNPNPIDSSLLARIDRLEALDQIRQLPAKYALALDMRDMDAMVSLFPADVRVGREASGRAALRAYMDGTLRSPFTGTSHHIGGHVIEFDDPDHAHGVVYSKNEHETPVADGPGEWVIMQMMYVDDYVRQDGRWYFERRLPSDHSPPGQRIFLSPTGGLLRSVAYQYNGNRRSKYQRLSWRT